MTVSGQTAHDKRCAASNAAGAHVAALLMWATHAHQDDELPWIGGWRTTPCRPSRYASCFFTSGSLHTAMVSAATSCAAMLICLPTSTSLSNSPGRLACTAVAALLQTLGECHTLTHTLMCCIRVTREHKQACRVQASIGRDEKGQQVLHGNWLQLERQAHTV